MKDEIKEILYVLKHIVVGRASRLTCSEADKLLKYITNLQKNYERIYNENCKLREKHNITDISLLDENNRLQEKIKEILDKLKESAIWYEDSKQLLDYITNLQKENKRLKEYIKIANVSEWFKGNDELDNLLQGKSDE